MSLLKLLTNRSRAIFMVLASDHVTGATGLTLTITASKDGAAFGSITPTVTELASGWYKLALTTSHTDTLGDFALHITGTAADPTDLLDEVVTDLPGLSVTTAAAVTTVNGLAAGVITASSIASDAITSAKLADGAITAAKLASGALDAVWSTAARTLTAFGFSVTVGTNNDKTGYGLSSAGVQAVWDALTSALTTSGSIGKWILDKLDVVLSTRLATAGYTAPPSALAIANEVEAQIIDDTDSEKVLTAITDKIASVNPSLGGLTVAAIASQVRTELTVELARIDAAISSRSTYAGGDTSGVTSLLARLTSTRAGYLDGLSAGVPTATGIASQVRTELATELARIDAAISSRLATAGYTAPANSTIATIASAVVSLAIEASVQAAITAIATRAATGAAMTLTSGERTAVADAHLDQAAGVETGLTVRQAHRLTAAAAAGKRAGFPDAFSVRDVADTKPRIAGTADDDGNTLTLTVDKT